MSSLLTMITINPKKNSMINDNQVLLCSHLSTQLCIGDKPNLVICLGKKILTVNIQITTDIAPNEIQLPEDIMKDFLLPVQTYKFFARYVPEKHTLYLGPVVGLLTNFKPQKDEEPNFRTIHLFCEELHHGISEFGGLFYVFSFKDFSVGGVHGYHFKSGKWVLSEFPLPDVIYNRIHSRKLEQFSSFKSFRKELEQLNIPFFNDHFLSKWEVHEQLMEEEKIHSNIPETCIFSKERLKHLIEKHHTVFIKPVHGSQGRNIIKLFQEDDYFSYQDSQNAIQNIIVKKHSLDEIFHQIKPLLQNRIYIIQQGIPLTVYQSRPMDFRVLCHKNQLNLWEVTSLVARISSDQQFVSNIAKGGKTLKPLHALSFLFTKKMAKEIISLMKELSLEAASTISKHSTGITGELGVDIGVDTTGKPWIIEINSKPSKNFEDNNTKIRPSAKALIKFCIKLAFDEAIEKEE